MAACAGRLAGCCSSPLLIEASSSVSEDITCTSSSVFLSSASWKHHRFCPRPLQTQASPRRQPLNLKVTATVGYPASISWWKKGERLSNVHEITSSDGFYGALHDAALLDKLVMVDFYAAGCRACKAMHPKICKIAEENPSVEILTVNFYDNTVFCRSLSVNVLPFFHFYRGSEGRVDAFSCSLSKIEKLRAAVSKYQGDGNVLTRRTAPSYVGEQDDAMLSPALLTV